MNTTRPILIDFLRIAAGVWLALSLLFSIYHLGAGVISFTQKTALDRNVTLRTDIHIVIEDVQLEAFDKTFAPHYFGEGRIDSVSNDKNIQLVSHIQLLIMALFSATLAYLLRQALVRVRDEQPFSQIVIRNITIAGWVIIFYQFIDMGSRSLTNQVLNLQELFGGAPRFSLDAEMLALGIVFIVIGELLQHAHEVEEDLQLTV